jgi:branched-chain amino acid transport system permease protein
MRSNLLLIVVIAVLVALSFVTGQIDDYYYRILIMAGVNITLAVSLNLINGFTGQFSLGHAGFMAIGAYLSAIVSTYMLSHGWESAGINGIIVLTIGLVAGGLFAALGGLAVGIPTLRLRGDYLAIATLGFNEIIRVIIQNVDFRIDGTSYVGGARGFSVTQLSDFTSVFLVAALAVWLVENLVNSTYGRGFLAVRDDEVAAEAMGVNTTKFKVQAFTIGAFFAGVGGGLYAHFNNFLSPNDFTFLKSIDIVVMVILGGMGSTVGVILAAIVLTILPEVLREFASYRMIIYSLLLIILMIARPQGLLGPEVVKTLLKRKKAKPAAPIT